MSINHFSTDLPEALWWSQQQQNQPINMEPNPNSPPFKSRKTNNPPPPPSWQSLHWLKQPHPMFSSVHNPSPNLNLNHQNDDAEEQQQKDAQLNRTELQLKEPMFEKPLTPSDVGKLNRLVIPKQHAEKYFPLSGDSVDKGLLLSFEDELGKCWRFRYSYWNSSQSYVLTKGWSRYVKEKQLDAGDVVSFERHRIDGERLFIGWRRRGDNSGGGGGMMVQGNNGGGWSRGGLHQPYQHHPHGANVTARVPFQHECLHAGSGGGQKQTIVPIGNSKRLRLFGVNMECQLDESEPSTPDGSSSMSSQGQHFYPSNSPYNSSSNAMDISLSRDVNQMRNRRG